MMPVCVPTAARTILCQLLKGKGDESGWFGRSHYDSRVQNGELMIKTHVKSCTFIHVGSSRANDLLSIVGQECRIVVDFLTMSLDL